MKRSGLLVSLALCAGVLGSVFLIPRAVYTKKAAPPDVAAQQPTVSDPFAVAMTPLNGTSAMDSEIRGLQDKIKTSSSRNPLLERLGWAFVAKARLTSDPGFYNLAEQAAGAITTDSPNEPSALLLLGHIRDSQHRFSEAELIARNLVSQREFVFDYALLGDALMEQGKLGEAVEAYQKMIDLKPCLQTYSRVAYMRWLKGDLPGALQVIALAVSAGNPREPEPTAWAYTRLASYQLQAHQTEKAMTNVDLALQAAPDYAPSLLMRGRLLLSAGKADEAVASLQQAAEICPLPEYLWTLSEALRANGDIIGAGDVEAKLAKTGAAADPRTFSLFLATRGQDSKRALALASSELAARQDVFTYDAIAWAKLANGDVASARENIRLALAEGTQDARLFFHAGAIAASAREDNEALQFFTKAHAVEQTLLPSERQALSQRTAALIGHQSAISVK